MVSTNFLAKITHLHYRIECLSLVSSFLTDFRVKRDVKQKQYSERNKNYFRSNKISIRSNCSYQALTKKFGK